MSNVLLEAVDLVKVYGDQNGDSIVAALRGCDFTLHENKFMAVVGPSGAGKTTLIRLLSGMELPTSGTIFLRQLPIHLISRSERQMLRRRAVGFLHQLPWANLFVGRTAQENIQIPLIFRGFSRKKAINQAYHILQELNLTEVAHLDVSKLSGGETLRVGIGIQIAKEPLVLFADEPTGQLDRENTKAVLSILQKLVHEYQTSVIIVTHDFRVIDFADQVNFIQDGRLTTTLAADAFQSQTARDEKQYKEEKEKAMLLTRETYIDSTSHTRLPQEVIDFLQLNRSVKFIIDQEKGEVRILNPQKSAISPETLPGPPQEITPTHLTSKIIKEVIPSTDVESIHVSEKITSVESLKTDMLPTKSLPKPTVKIEELSVSYQDGRHFRPIFTKTDFVLHPGELVFLIGPSGSGKSTFLDVLQGIRIPNHGNVKILGIDITNESDEKIANLRGNKIGTITQYFDLHPNLTLKENLTLFPSVYHPTSPQFNLSNPWASTLVDLLELEPLLDHSVTTLSGGEQQRAGVMNALLSCPDLIFADEPTANLPPEYCKLVIQLIRQYVEKTGAAGIVATHNSSLLLEEAITYRIESGMLQRLNQSEIKELKEIAEKLLHY